MSIHNSYFKSSVILSLFIGVMLSGSAYAGFYTAMGIGVRPLSVNFTKFNVAGVRIRDLDESVTRTAGDLFIGYDHVFNHGIYLGGEAFYEYIDMSASVGASVQAFGVTINERVSAELDSNFGTGVLFGYKSHNADIFYSRFGLLFDELHYKAQQQVTGVSNSVTKGQQYVGAVQLGLGVVHPFNKNWSIRGEYTYTRYPDVGVDIKVTVPTVGSTTIVSFTPEVSINAATISLIYSFA